MDEFVHLVLPAGFVSLGRVRSILSRVRFILSTKPFPWGWYGVVLECVTPESSSSRLNKRFSNSPPMSWWSFPGNPKRGIKSLKIMSAEVMAVLFFVVYHNKNVFVQSQWKAFEEEPLWRLAAMVPLLVDLDVFVLNSGMCDGWSFLCLSSCVPNKISHGLKLAPSQRQDGPFPHDVHGKRSAEISVEELFAGWFLFRWGFCHSFRSLRTKGGSLYFSATVGRWFALMNLRARPMWGSSFCAFATSTTLTWLQAALDRLSTWRSSPSSSIRAVNQIESPFDNVWIAEIDTHQLDPGVFWLLQ